MIFRATVRVLTILILANVIHGATDDIKEEKSGPVIEIKGKTGGSATKPRSIRKKTPLKSPNKTPKRNSTQLKKTIQQPVLVNLPVSSAVSTSGTTSGPITVSGPISVSQSGPIVSQAGQSIQGQVQFKVTNPTVGSVDGSGQTILAVTSRPSDQSKTIKIANGNGQPVPVSISTNQMAQFRAAQNQQNSQVQMKAITQMQSTNQGQTGQSGINPAQTIQRTTGMVQVQGQVIPGQPGQVKPGQVIPVTVSNQGQMIPVSMNSDSMNFQVQNQVQIQGFVTQKVDQSQGQNIQGQIQNLQTAGQVSQGQVISNGQVLMNQPIQVPGNPGQHPQGIPGQGNPGQIQVQQPVPVPIQVPAGQSPAVQAAVQRGRISNFVPGQSGNAMSGQKPFNGSSNHPMSNSHSAKAQKPLIIPTGSIEEEIHPEFITLSKYKLYQDDFETPSNLCFIGCVFYFDDRLKSTPPYSKLDKFDKRIKIWKKAIQNYGGLVEETYNAVTCTHVVSELLTSDVVQRALADNIRCVTPWWIDWVMSIRKMQLPTNLLHVPLPITNVQIAKGTVITSEFRHLRTVP